MMSDKDIENRAYRIATGNCLTETFNKEEYDSMTAVDVYNYVWEPFEILSENGLCSQIDQIADEIIKFAKEIKESA